MLSRASQPGGPRQIHEPWVCEHQPWGQSHAGPSSPEQRRGDSQKSGSSTHRTWGTHYTLWCSEYVRGGDRSHAHLLQQPLLLVNKRAHRSICAAIPQGHHRQPRCSQLRWGHGRGPYVYAHMPFTDRLSAVDRLAALTVHAHSLFQNTWYEKAQ